MYQELQKKTIRILRIIARLNVGGPAIQAISLTSELSSDSYQSMLVCGNVSPHEGDMTYLAREKDIQPFVIPELGREISVVDDWKAFLAIRRIIKRFKPHIIHTHTAKAGTLGRFAAFSMNLGFGDKDKIKVVHTFHGHVFHGYFSLLKTFVFIQIERLLAKFTDRIVVISALQKRDICDRFRVVKRDKVSVIPLGFDLSGFSDCEKYRKIMRQKYISHEPCEAFFVGAIGRLTPVKNHSLLLQALKYLNDQGKGDPFRFLIVGDGELRAELIDEALDLGVRDQVIFVGWQRDMPPIYGALDAVVLTSKNEGTPVTLIEAMASGKPVVATDVGGVRDLLGGSKRGIRGGFELARNGILVPPGDAKTFADALLFIQENREICAQMVRNSTDFAVKQYSLKRLLDDIKSLYDELIETGSDD
jgi:glycosyltransferase involved in cell wall biosynthesis